ncbi:hypothetical protein SAMN02990966_06239 [Rhodospirillales bacterium URHD0017]|nr:hypothetical protein SAMN02990966_06239 [Rhodospirillales bacterium URHD0017]
MNGLNTEERVGVIGEDRAVVLKFIQIPFGEAEALVAAKRFEDERAAAGAGDGEDDGSVLARAGYRLIRISAEKARLVGERSRTGKPNRARSPKVVSELMMKARRLTSGPPGCFGRSGGLGARASEPLTLARWSAGRAKRVRLKAVLIRPT